MKRPKQHIAHQITPRLAVYSVVLFLAVAGLIFLILYADEFPTINKVFSGNNSSEQIPNPEIVSLEKSLTQINADISNLDDEIDIISASLNDNQTNLEY
jgi:peptidoglycan hydrolase CwlO-like protein